MTADSFFKVFDKLYGKKEGKIFLFNIAHGLTFFENKETGRTIGMGITPERFVGIRLTDEEKFYLRNTESNILYKVSQNELDICDHPYSGIFRTIKKMVKTLQMSGAEILLHNECPDFTNESYLPGIIMAFFYIFKKPVTLYDYYIEGEKITSDDILGITSVKNCISVIGNGQMKYTPVNFAGYKIILILCGDNKINMDVGGEEFSLAEEYLSRGDVESFGGIIKNNALKVLKKGIIKTIFDIASMYSSVCGITENGSVYIFLEDSKVDEKVKVIDDKIFEKSGQRAEFYICTSDGSGIIKS